MTPLTPSLMGKRSHKNQKKKYGGLEGYKKEMQRRAKLPRKKK